MTPKIRRAVIAVAGFGTRFLPATKAQPKEMLAVVDKPIIQYVVEEMVGAGIEEIVLVTGQNKRSIEDHFDRSFELEYRLKEAHKLDLLEEVKRISNLAKFIYVRQKMPLGNGHALLCAKVVVDDEPFAFSYGDDIIEAKIPAIGQMIKVFEKYQGSVMGVMEVPREKISQFGVIKPQEIEKGVYKVLDTVEKPHPDDAPSNLASVGRYVFTPKIFEALEETKPGKGGEIWVADGVKNLCRNETVYACKLEGTYWNCGDKREFLKATINFALKNPEFGRDLRKYLRNRV
ncbi:UTP--glucose-1-phosphate uridylyltransferase GalU [Candidatus Aerophobetes bacterium]|uniref:UTP--glucose-1-phosphate uridylyltransferase n=1 Tax=Aerophobetes bacterium TaxID=2030807 RepID=A0A523YLU4_UNCAE|nr:MAG: UTP--glucose-1-phosphate uridylyltransferase GalU [Candidatus Aerophobetes bacterium]